MSLIAKPIDDLNVALKWADESTESTFQRAPLRITDNTQLNKPKIVVCHDMKNGYLHDRFAQGCCCNSDIYTSIYTQSIDTFIYFSHHLISIPPQQWIDMCHNNGIKVLGTFITENKEGFDICMQIFRNEAQSRQLAIALSNIAKYFQFDGWLINIENPICMSNRNISGGVEQIQHTSLYSSMENLCFIFLDELKTSLGKNRSVIWYDAVTYQGRLQWQNALNEENLPFFNICGNIFLNYNWTLQDLQTSVTNSENRVDCVYAGIDVFGRNCIGGFDSYKSFNTIAKNGLSSAIFAPGWVLEHLGSAEFLKNQHRLWTSIMRQETCSQRPITDLPFATCFSTGRGSNFRVVRLSEIENGKEQLMSNESWSYLPMTTRHTVDQCICPTEHDAFVGGSCAEILGLRKCYRLIDFNVSISGTVKVCIAYKMNDCTLEVSMKKNGHPYCVFLPERNASKIYKINGWILREHIINQSCECQLQRIDIYCNNVKIHDKIGLLSVENVTESREPPLNPMLINKQCVNNKIYVVVQLENPNFQVVNAYRRYLNDDTRCNQLLASSSNRFICLLLKKQSNKSHLTESSELVTIEFRTWSQELYYTVANFEQTETITLNIQQNMSFEKHFEEDDEVEFNKLVVC